MLKSLYLIKNKNEIVEKWQRLDCTPRKSALKKDQVYLAPMKDGSFRICIGRDLASLINFNCGERAFILYDRLNYSKIKLEKSHDGGGALINAPTKSNTLYLHLRLPEYFHINKNITVTTSINFDFDYASDEALILDLSKFK